MTIWELLDEATRGLPTPFTRADVLRWFRVHHPEINQPSVSAHLQSATSNAPEESKHLGLRGRRPLITRVGRGQYVRFGELPSDPHAPKGDRDTGRTALPTAERPRPPVRRVALVGCGRAKRNSAAPAGELYTSTGFRLRAAYAEQHADRWFVLSAEYGLVESSEWASPYDLDLSDTEAHYRVAWGEWVVARLKRLLGSLDGVRVDVIAPVKYADPIREPLEENGATVHEPLHGLRQGEQLAWLVGNVDDPDPGPPSYSDPRARDQRSLDVAIASALLAYREIGTETSESRLGFAQSSEADELLRADPFAFLLGVIFDEGIKAEKAWEAPYLLKQRLGHLDPTRIRSSRVEVKAAVAQRPSLHRYLDLMTDAVVEAAARVCDEYSGAPSAIWSDSPTTGEVDARLQRFRRIGPKKAAMAVEMLVTNFGTDLGDHTGTNVAYDVHVRRVFLRSGLVEYDSFEEVTAAGRRLNPERPGLLDLPTWLIGRRWCHPTLPQCLDCALNEVCRKRTHLNVRG